MTKEEFEELKQDFLQKNAVFVEAVKGQDFENYNSLENKLSISELHLKAASSYATLVTAMKKAKHQISK